MNIRKEDYKNYYEINSKPLGQSSFAIIYKGTDKKSKESKAIKIYEIERVKAFLKNNLKRIPTEEELKKYFDAFENEAINMNILQGKNKENENAVILDNCFETENEFTIVMEKCDDNLFNHLADRKKSFNSEEIHEILKQLNNSFKIMVENKILHRAIKLQNILLKYLNEKKTEYIVKLKLTDDCCLSDNSSKFLDTNFDRNYRIYSPEVLNEKDFTEQSDLWSVGILIYTLYTMVFPFNGKTKAEVLSKITEDSINNLNLKKCEDIDLNDLFKKLLVIEPNSRISWKEYFIHPFFKKRMDFTIFYEKSNFIGYCTHGSIYKGKDKKSGQKKAIKIYDKNLIKNQLKDKRENVTKIPDDDEEFKKIIEGFYNEVNLMKILQGLYNENQNTVICDEYFNTESEFVIIMELCDSNLLDYFIEEKNHKLNSKEIHEIISQLNNSFKIMVKNKIVHRAIKPQNILLKYLNKEKTEYIVKLKLTDDSGLLDSNNLINQDTINNDDLSIYAPEVLEEGKYTEKSDLFSLGILMYYLYFDKYPFGEKEKDKILNNIKKEINIKTDNPEFDDLLKKLLKGNEKERISWEEYFKHKFFRTNQDFINYYEYEKEVKLGQCGHGIIYKAKDKKTGEMKAIKKVDRISIESEWKDQANEIRQPTDDDLKEYYKGFFNEINNMKILQGINNQNQNTVIFNEYFNTKESFAYVMELCDGNLLDYIEKIKKNKDLDIDEIKNILIQLNNSFKIMYENKILHLAIKPENILYKEDKDSIFKLKLTDSCCLLGQTPKIDIKNNLCVSAPEVLRGEKIKEQSDLWSLGILIYYLKFKEYPFNGNDESEILSQIEKVNLEETKLKKTNNEVFVDLVKKLLTVDSKKRMSWRTYFDHPFFK